MEYIDNTILTTEGITGKRKNPICSIIILVIGACMVWKSSELDSLIPSMEIGGALTAVGAMIALYGFIKLLIICNTKKRIPYFNGKPLKRIEKFYEGDKLVQLCNAVNNKDLNAIEKIETSSISAVILV